MDITAILGLLNPLKWVKEGWKYLRQPKLRVYFDPDKTYLTVAVANRGGAPGFFCHLMVGNDGKETARNCQAKLVKVSTRESDGGYRPHPDFVNAVVLKWAHEPDLQPRDIDPDLPKRLDLCYAVQSIPDVFSFFMHKVPTGNRTDFPAGTYRVTVCVDAENAARIDRTFVISCNGVWDQIRVSEE